MVEWNVKNFSDEQLKDQLGQGVGSAKSRVIINELSERRSKRSNHKSKLFRIASLIISGAILIVGILNYSK